MAFVDVLERDGRRRASVARTTSRCTGGAPLRGVEVDFGDISDTAQTLAVVAPFATVADDDHRASASSARKETDRIAAVVTELRRCGIRAEELADGIRIHPGTPRPATVRPTTTTAWR